MSDTNNNIPTRITQLEEATEYEDGMFYAVAKAGRGTYKIPVDEMTPNEQALSDKMENEIVPAVENSFAYGTVENQSIATFNDGAPLPLAKLEIAVEPQQDLHGYDAPWAGGAGSNKWDEQWESGTYNTATGSKSTDTSRIRSKNPIKVSANTTYYFVKPSGKLVYLYYYDSNNNFISYADPFQTSGTGGTFTTPSNAEYLCFSILQTSYSSGIAVNFPSSVTSYTPYSNICPISGWSAVDVNVSGVNIWDEEWEIDGNYRLSSKNYIPVKANTEYLFGNTLLYSITCYDINKNSLGGASLTQVPNIGYKFTTKPNTYYIKFNVGNSYGTTYNNDISINYPSTDTDYHAYNGHTYTIDLDGTRYGGKLDVVSGVLTVTHETVDLGAFSYSNSNSKFSTGINAKAKGLHNLISSNYKTSTAISSNFMNDKEVIGNANSEYITIYDTEYTDATTFKNAMQGVQLVYELATPTTIQLSPTQVNSLMGVNNIFTNTGKILKVEYIRDLDIVINSLLERIAALEG